MAYYTRKPELVEAIQWTGENLQEIVDFVGADTSLRIAFKNPKIGFKVCYMDLEGYDGPEDNIVTIFVGYSNNCSLYPTDYLICHDYSDNPDIWPFEVMRDYRFKLLYQPDSCSLHDQMRNASIQTNIYPAKNDIEQEISISKGKDVKDAPISEEDEELATVLIWFIIGMIVFTLFFIGATISVA